LQILKSLDEKIAASDDDDVDQKVDAKDKAEDINEALSIVDDAQAMLDKKRRREDDEPEDEPPSKR
jgi:hypothetical protein